MKSGRSLRSGSFRRYGSLQGRWLGLALALVCALVPGTSDAQLPGGYTWQFLWGDEFSGTEVDTTKWLKGEPGWSNSSQSLANPDGNLATLGGGELTLTAIRDAVGGGYEKSFRGGSITTYPFGSYRIQKPTFSTGIFVEARIKLPDTPGSWPALWALDPDAPTGNELDIMEYPLNISGGSGYANNEFHTAFHYNNYGAAGGGKVGTGSNLGDSNYRVFSALWDGQLLIWYLNGAEVKRFDNPAVNQMNDFYLLLNYAVGGNPDTWIGRPSTAEWPVGWTDETKVDWIRVWRSASASTTNWAGGGAGANAQWGDNNNWTNFSPTLGGVTSRFSTISPETEQTIDIPGNRTTSVINLDGDTRYRFGWDTDRLVLGFGNGGAIQPTINMASTTTTEHEFWVQLEWSGNLNINNDSPTHPLLMTGPVLGGDGIYINGPGVVSFDRDNNTYSGRTIIDSGSAGSGVARTRGQNSLGSGLVVIGEQGNATTARLELESDALLSNTVDLHGRNNDSAGIVNISGNSTISGTVYAIVGGDRYWIQSDAGHMEISGATGNGTAIASFAGGTRTFTLKGAGAGTVSGVIDDGNATVSLVKADAGTWTLDETNTYTGTTTVHGGTLVVNGSTGSGVTTIIDGTTLAGRGTINGNFTAPSGSTVRAGASGFPIVSLSPFTLLDNFDSYDNSSDTKTTVATGGVWASVFDGTNNSHIIDSDQGQSLRTSGGAAWRGAERNLTGTDAAVLVGETQTYFWQVKASSTGGAFDFMMGLSPSVANIDDVNAYNDFNVMPFVNNAAATPYINAEAPTNPWWAPMDTDSWYNVWVVVNNDTTSPNYDLYYSEGTNAPVLVAADANWRNTGILPVGNTLNAIGFMAAGGAGSELLVDNIYFAPGEELRNPLDFFGLPPVPLAEALNVEGHFTLSPGATLELDVSTGSLHDKVVTSGPFNASGILKVTLDPAQSEPMLGDRFDLIDSAGGTINFSSYDLPPLAEGLKWDTGSIGTGELSVVADPANYAGWVGGYSFSEGEEGMFVDVEPDGLVNAFEWLYGTNPLVSDAGGLNDSQVRAVSMVDYPGADPAKTYLTMTRTIRKNITGMTLIPQGNISLEFLNDPSSSGFVYSQLLNDLGDFEEREWIYTIPVEDFSTGFMRLNLVPE